MYICYNTTQHKRVLQEEGKKTPNWRNNKRLESLHLKICVEFYKWLDQLNFFSMWVQANNNIYNSISNKNFGSFLLHFWVYYSLYTQWNNSSSFLCKRSKWMNNLHEFFFSGSISSFGLYGFILYTYRTHITWMFCIYLLECTMRVYSTHCRLGKSIIFCLLYESYFPFMCNKELFIHERISYVYRGVVCKKENAVQIWLL